jgi:hypothetical protein
MKEETDEEAAMRWVAYTEHLLRIQTQKAGLPFPGCTVNPEWQQSEDGKWHHIVHVPENGHTYIDGKLQAVPST